MAALALAKWAFCLCKAALLFLAPANRRRVPPVQSMIPATWLAQSLLRQGVTFGVARGGVGEVGLSIKAASPDAPSSRTCFQRLLLNWLSATCLTTNSYCTAATNRNTFILLLPTPGSTTRRHSLRVNRPRRTILGTKHPRDQASRTHMLWGPHTPAQITPRGCGMLWDMLACR